MIGKVEKILKFFKFKKSERKKFIFPINHLEIQSGSVFVKIELLIETQSLKPLKMFEIQMILKLKNGMLRIIRLKAFSRLLSLRTF